MSVPKRSIFIFVSLLILCSPAPLLAQGPDLTGSKWKLSFDFLNRTFTFIQGKPGQPVRFVEVLGEGDYKKPEGRFGWDGTYDGKRVVLNDRDVNSTGQTRVIDLQLSSDGNRLTGTETDSHLEGSTEVEFVRIGAPIVGLPKTPSDVGSYLKKIFGGLILILILILVIYQFTKANKDKESKKQTDYLLHLKTVDERTTLNADGADILWIYAIIVCTDPKVNTTAVTSTLTFTPDGPNAAWLIFDKEPQMISGFKVASVRAWPPSYKARLENGEARILVSSSIEGQVLSGSISLGLNHFILEFM